ncbi:hypothetical protein vBCtySFA70_00016 [Clostridium phage vB_CtyS-FA70]|nr:hypothetical protein vBCtySFA70_00016 [Clostridium phage vB_CtyS-FA70]
MASFEGITFNNIPMPYFVHVKNIKHRILPTISQNLLTVGGRAGSYDYGNVVGNREIDVDIQIITPEPNVLPAYLAILSEWLYYEDARELILGDNPNRYYIAKISGDTDITEDFVVGEGTLKFVCTDPFIYGESKMNIIDSYDGEILKYENNGTAPVTPIMQFTISKDITSFSIISGDEVVDFGSPVTVDTSPSQIVDYKGYVLNDTLNNMSGWSTAPSISGGSVTGTFEVYGGHCFRQAGLDYGSGTAWHGASMIKSMSRSVSDFSSKFSFRINNESSIGYLGSIVVTASSLKLMAAPDSSSRVVQTVTRGTKLRVVRSEGWWYYLSNGTYCLNDTSLTTLTTEEKANNMIGKVMFYLLDENGLPVVEMLYGDLVARANTCTVEINLINGSTRKKVAGSTIANYTNSLGSFLIERVGRVWNIGLSLEGFDGKTSTSSLTYVDWDDQFRQAVNRVQIATLAYQDYKTPYMELWDVSVTSEESFEKPKDDEIPLILRAGDVLTVDNTTGVITKNGLPFYEFLNPASTFIHFEKGANGLVISPSDSISEGLVSYREKYL